MATPKKAGTAKKQTGAARKRTTRKTASSATGSDSAEASATKASAKKAASSRTGAAKKKSAAAKPSKSDRKSTSRREPRKATAKKAVTAPEKLEVRDDESPWTVDELDAVRGELQGDVDRLSSELSGFETEILGLMGEGGDGPGDDQADVGTKTFEREHEYFLAQNSRDLLEQSHHALERIADGTYGICEHCGNPIGKMRLQAFPRATLCMSCKQKQERH